MTDRYLGDCHTCLPSRLVRYVNSSVWSDLDIKPAETVALCQVHIGMATPNESTVIAARNFC